MHRLNVRCCCQPTKILGTLEVPTLDHWQRIAFAIRRPITDFVPSAKADTMTSETFSEEIQILPFNNADGSLMEMAIYSDDRPIEFWRKFPGFIEQKT